MSRMLKVSLLALSLATSLQVLAADCGKCTPAEAAQCKAKSDPACAKKCTPEEAAKCKAEKSTEGSKKSVDAPRPAAPSTR